MQYYRGLMWGGVLPLTILQKIQFAAVAILLAISIGVVFWGNGRRVSGMR